MSAGFPRQLLEGMEKQQQECSTHVQVISLKKTHQEEKNVNLSSKTRLGQSHSTAASHATS